MMSELMIETGTFARRADTVAVSIRMPWYRALPLSSVADVQWTIDGQPVARESITWTVDGVTYRLDELPDRHDSWWYVLDSVELAGACPDLPAGSTHEVSVVLSLYIPYITTDLGVLKLAERDTKTMPLALAVAE